MATTVGVAIDFSNGASFGYPFLLNDPDYGILGTNILADSPQDLSDITDQVIRVSTRRGRNRILSNFEAGSATVVLNDPDSDFSPFNPASPYYTKLLPLRKIRIFANVDTFPERVYLFSGYITSYDTGFYQGTDQTATVTLECVDGFRLLNNVSTGVSPVPGCPAGQLSGARVNTLLDSSGFPESMQVIFPGQTTMQEDPGGARSILQAIQTVEQSEFGAFYMTRAGEARFLDRDLVSQLADVTPRYYTDNSTPGSLQYASVDFAYDDQLILNDVTVTRYDDDIGPDPVPQNVFDQDSIDTYFIKSGQRTGILVQTDQVANDQARTLLVARKDADVRIDSMTLDIYADLSEEATFVNLSSDIYSLVVITKTMPAEPGETPSFISRELFIQGVQHDVTPNSWTTVLLTAEPIIQAFILDSSSQGLVSINNLSY